MIVNYQDDIAQFPLLLSSFAIPIDMRSWHRSGTCEWAHNVSGRLMKRVTTTSTRLVATVLSQSVVRTLWTMMSQQLKLPRVIASATLVLPTSYFMSHDLTNLVSVVVWSRYDLVACKDLKRKTITNLAKILRYEYHVLEMSARCL